MLPKYWAWRYETPYLSPFGLFKPLLMFVWGKWNMPANKNHNKMTEYFLNSA